MTAVGRGVLVLALAQALSASATETDDLLGVWEQVASNAGACPTCRIAFRAENPGLSVIANNGWAAKLHGSHENIVVGAGRWDEGKYGWVAGRPFTISFRLEGDRLRMTMTVETGTEPKQVVQGIYKRHWRGM